MPTYVYAQSNGNWDATNLWNTQQGGGGTPVTNPQGDYVCDLNGHQVAVNVNVAVTEIRSSNGSLSLSGAGTVSVQVLRLVAGSASNVVVSSGVNYVTAGQILLESGTGSADAISINAGATLQIDECALMRLAVSTAHMVRVPSGATFVFNGDVIEASGGSYKYAVFVNSGGLARIKAHARTTNVFTMAIACDGTLYFRGCVECLAGGSGVALNNWGAVFNWYGDCVQPSNARGLIIAGCGTIRFFNPDTSEPLKMICHGELAIGCTGTPQLPPGGVTPRVVLVGNGAFATFGASERSRYPLVIRQARPGACGLYI